MLDPVLIAKLSALGTFVGTACHVHLRGKVRHGLLRQFTDHSTLMAPYNSFVYLFSGVPNRPVLDVGTLPSLALLRDSWKTIREEANRLYEAGYIRPSEKCDDLAFNSFFRRGWKRFYLKLHFPLTLEKRQFGVFVSGRLSGQGEGLLKTSTPDRERFRWTMLPCLLRSTN